MFWFTHDFLFFMLVKIKIHASLITRFFDNELGSNGLDFSKHFVISPTQFHQPND